MKHSECQSVKILLTACKYSQKMMRPTAGNSVIQIMSREQTNELQTRAYRYL